MALNCAIQKFASPVNQKTQLFKTASLRLCSAIDIVFICIVMSFDLIVNTCYAFSGHFPPYYLYYYSYLVRLLTFLCVVVSLLNVTGTFTDICVILSYSAEDTTVFKKVEFCVVNFG